MTPRTIVLLFLIGMFILGVLWFSIKQWQSHNSETKTESQDGLPRPIQCRDNSECPNETKCSLMGVCVTYDETLPVNIGETNEEDIIEDVGEDESGEKP